MQLPATRPKNREVEDEMIHPPEKPGGPPRAATEPAKSHGQPRKKDQSKRGEEKIPDEARQIKLPSSLYE
jgi:hypothetical protein